ncbi:hypothetical protein [Pseudoxanthomonas indica]|uniref:Uncharacterized protein n=1 Tax=Pseudoxanthomonas indica TaxID=428993 RepID=A0A1T5LX31_9GAMM|nr:hypothetical protein [Pseudoxanthomonas indica]GGD40680.1 hypothetical protein GCM10007235_10890 [Pseudoxanthomonas indica]SKC80138.1 hypothetical protein SAMN06296058_3220 [Pseudoxanthomonas indica]
MNLFLTLTAMKQVAKTEKGRAQLRESRKQAMAFRDKDAADFEQRTKKVNTVIHNIGIALGEIEA